MENIDHNADLPEIPDGTGNLLSFGRTFYPLMSILLSVISTTQNMDIILTIILKLTSLATFVIYVVINWENIKVQIHKWMIKHPQKEKEVKDDNRNS